MTATTTESTSRIAQGEEETGSAAESCPTPAAVPVLAAIQAPAAVIAPYLGLVAAVLCALGGGWLLLAPYALDLRRGAAKLPRTAAVDLATGAAITAVAAISAGFFAAALFSRLRPRIDRGEPQPGPELAEPDTEPEAAPEPPPQPAPQPGPEPSGTSSALREMLTPLVAALAADLRSQDRRQEP
jgi:hypothetical protein